MAVVDTDKLETGQAAPTGAHVTSVVLAIEPVTLEHGDHPVCAPGGESDRVSRGVRMKHTNSTAKTRQHGATVVARTYRTRLAAQAGGPIQGGPDRWTARRGRAKGLPAPVSQGLAELVRILRYTNNAT